MTTAMFVTYKIKGTKMPPEAVYFNGPYIRCSDLKEEISKQRKIAQSGDVELVVQDEQSGKEFNDFDVIPRLTQVLVSRRVVGNVSTMKSDRDEQSKKLLVPPDPEKAGSITVALAEQIAGKKRRSGASDGSPKTAKLTLTAASPDRRDQLLEQEQYSVKRAVGIPRTKLMIVDGPNYKGAVMTNSGHYAVSKIDAKAYNEAENVSKILSHEEAKSMTPPPELVCSLCQELCRDAALVPCCKASFCDECIRDELLVSDDQLCPKCKMFLTPSSILPNWDVRKEISAFNNVIAAGEQQENIVSTSIKQEEVVKQEVSASEQQSNLEAANLASQLYWNQYWNQLSLWMLMAQQQQQQQQQPQQRQSVREKPSSSPKRKHRQHTHRRLA